MRHLPGLSLLTYEGGHFSTAWHRQLLAESGHSNGGGGGSSGSGTVVYVVVSIALITFSGMMAGLTLGLLSLSSVEIEVLRRSGTDCEKARAAKIAPVLKRPHLLLSTLLICNAAALEALPLVIHKFLSEVVSIVLAVTAVLIFGEILPQAVCSRHALAIGAFFSKFVRLLMLICSPVAYPLSKVLDYFLGRDQTALFRREHFKTLVDLHGTDDGMGGGFLTRDEITVIRGALDLQLKTARHVLTPLNKVFMLPLDTILDDAILKRILHSGFSRFLVHQTNDEQQILGLLLCKELLLVDADDRVRVDTLKLRTVPRMAASTPLFELLRIFKAGHSHMVVLTKPDPVPSSPASRISKDRNLKTGCTVEMSAVSADVAPGTAVPNNTQAVEPTAGVETNGGPITELEKAADVGDILGIITLEDVIDELLDAEGEEASVQHVSSVPRADSPRLHAALPPRLQKLLALPTQPGNGDAGHVRASQTTAGAPAPAGQ